MVEKSRVGNEVATEHLAYAEASLMLVEGVMQVLLEKKLVTLDDLQTLFENAIETKQSFVDTGVHPEISKVASGVLRRLANSVAATDTVKRPD